MGGITKALLLLLTVLHFKPVFGFKLNTVSERLDHLEIKLLTERIERRKSFRNMEHSVENIEERLNISLAQDGSSGGEIQHIERKLNEIKKLLTDIQFRKISETLHVLRKGLIAEKKQSLRFRRRVSQIENVLASLSNNSETSTKNIFAYFEDLQETNKALRETNEGLRETNEGLRETNEGLRETNKIMKEMYDNTSNALLHVTGVLDSMCTKIVNLLGSVKESAINKTMKEFWQEMKKTYPRENNSSPSCQISQPKSCLELLKCGHTESDVYSVFLGDDKIKVKI